MFKHLLVATDGSERAQKCAEEAVKFASETGARITFLYARPTNLEPYLGLGAIGDAHITQALKLRVNDLANDILERAAAEAKQHEIDYQTICLAEASPYESIIKGAEQEGCDLIFIASHGRDSVNSLVLGSVTQKVLSHTQIPVLVYR